MFVACVWLNQSVPLDAWREVQRRVWVTHEASWLEAARYPFVFLYRRSGDERLYHAVARSMRGEEPNRPDVRDARRHSGADFARELPPADGQWHAPYTEIPFEYPPLVLPFVLAPSYVSLDLQGYCIVFGVLMGLVLALAAHIVHSALEWSSAQRARSWWLGTAALLLHGSIAIQRLDALVALTLAVTLWAWQRGHLGRLGIALGLAGALKIVPLLLLAPVLGFDARLRGARARRIALAAVVTTALGLGALWLFGRVAPGSFFAYHAARGLHCESVAATVLGLVRWPFAPLGPASISYGSFNLDDPTATWIARALGPLLVAALVALGAYGLRHASPKPRAVPILVAGLCAIWLGSKVFSPQYLTWLLPFVSALPRARKHAALACTAVALFLSQLYFRGFFDAVYQMQLLGLSTLFVRDLAVLGLFVCCLRATRAPLTAAASRTAARAR